MCEFVIQTHSDFQMIPEIILLFDSPGLKISLK